MSAKAASKITKKPTISPPKAAKKLGVSDDSVRRWAEAGVFPGARRVGSHWKIPVDELDLAIGKPAAVRASA